MNQDSSGQARSILIVEDSPTQRERLKLLLQGKNYTVRTAGNGSEALDKAREQRPEVVVSDVMMPVMSGYDLCRTIKNDPELKDITVVLLTALSDPQDVINGLTSGADNFITKPYSDSFLLSRIEYIFVNKSIKHARMSDLGVEIIFGGKKHLINSNRLQIIDLLLSTYENAIQKNHELDSANRELAKTKQDLQSLNQRLQSQTDQLQSILESTSDGVLVISSEGKPIIMNPAARVMTGIEDLAAVEDLEAHSHKRMLFDESDQPVPFEQWPHLKALRGEEFTGLQYRTEIVGQEISRFLEFSSSLLRNAQGEISSVVITAHDITQQKQHELHLKEAKRLAEQRADELDVSNKELESFSYSLSHDLRSPLNSMKMFADFLKDEYREKLGDDGQQYLDHIILNTDKMNALIDDMLSLAKISRQEMVYKELDLRDIAEAIILELQHSEPQRKIEIHVAENLKAYGDEGLARIALRNLLGNAWKYTGKTENPRIEFGTKQFCDETVYYVQDNGAGFPMEKAKDVFKPFQRVHPDREFTGTGIGLAIVERVVARHGGRTWAEGEVGKGATFYFTLARGEYLGDS